MTSPERRPRQRQDIEVPPLIVGTELRCPRCRKLHNILQYLPMKRPEVYLADLNWVTKCPSCRFIFSPAARLLEGFDRWPPQPEWKEIE